MQEVIKDKTLKISWNTIEGGDLLKEATKKKPIQYYQRGTSAEHLILFWLPKCLKFIGFRFRRGPVVKTISAIIYYYYRFY